ncbi:hypothetical protein MTR67_001230, partial [Solanum verrucosum]
VTKKGIILGHKVSEKCLEVDRAKSKVVEKLPPFVFVKGVHSFLGHTGFYQRFIKDFSNIAHLLCKFFEKEIIFFLMRHAPNHLNLKETLISTPAIITPDWLKPFEVICYATGVALGVVLGQKCRNIFHLIYYARMVLNGI